MGNRPIIFTDPSGNTYLCGTSCEAEYDRPQYTLDQFAATLGITFSSGWGMLKKAAVLTGAYKVGKALQQQMNLDARDAYDACRENMASPTSTCSVETVSASEAFRSTYGSMYFQWETGTGSCGDASIPVDRGGCTRNAHKISFWSMSGGSTNDMSRMIKNVVHELGHAYNHILGGGGLKLPLSTNEIRNYVLRPNLDANGNPSPNHYDWQQHPPAMSEAGWGPSETFADVFVAWTYNAWNLDGHADSISTVKNWMNGLVP